MAANPVPEMRKALKRRHFLRLCGASSFAFPLLPAPRLSLMRDVLAADGLPARRHWAWAGARADEPVDDRRRRFAELRAAGVGSVLLGGADAENTALAAAEGLEVHAWTWTMCRGGDLLAEHPQWYAVSREGKSAADHPPYVPYYHFLCPTRPEVRAHLRGEFARIAATPGLAGVHLDYIRLPDVILPRALWDHYGLVQHDELPPYDFCYCEACRSAFAAQSGVDPLDLPDPPADEAWRRFRWDAVSGVVADLAGAVRAAGRRVTAAVFPSPSIARRLVRQDWAGWPLDAVLPMVYQNFYDEGVDWIEPTVREGVRALPADRPLYAGLYLPALQDARDFAAAVDGALAGGARGVALFGGVRDLGRWAAAR
jgi:hypothetical protein